MIASEGFTSKGVYTRYRNSAVKATKEIENILKTSPYHVRKLLSILI